MRLWLAILTFVTLVTSAAAQSGTATLRLGRALDGRGGVLSDVVVTVREGRITEITQEPGPTDYDLRAITVMPGGIDTHVHIGWHFDADGHLHSGANSESPAATALYAVENAYSTLLAGITTVQSLGAPLDGDVRDAVARGIIPGPRVLTSLGALFAESGPPDALRDSVRQLAARGADVIKIFASASIRDGGGPTMSQDQLDAACGEAREVGLRTAVHAHGPESARRAVLAGCTAIEHGSLLDAETFALMAERGTFYDPHIGLIFDNYFENKQRFLGVGNYTEEGFAQMARAVPLALAAFRRALDRPDLRIVFGTDAVAGAHGRNFEELIARVVRGGQNPMAAIVSATSLAAESLRLDHEIGAIAPGMRADLIGLEADPSRDITALRRVAFVMKDGRVYKFVPVPAP